MMHPMVMTAPERPLPTCPACGYRFVPAAADQWHCPASCEGRAALAGARAAAERFARSADWA